MACVFAATNAERLPRELDADTAWRRILTKAAPELADRLDHHRAASPPGCSPA